MIISLLLGCVERLTGSWSCVAWHWFGDYFLGYIHPYVCCAAVFSVNTVGIVTTLVQSQRVMIVLVLISPSTLIHSGECEGFLVRFSRRLCLCGKEYSAQILACVDAFGPAPAPCQEEV